MSYHFIHNARRNENPFRTAIVLVGFLVTVILFHFFYPTALADAIHTIAAPLWRLEGAFLGATHNTLSFFQSQSSLIAQVEQLETKLRIQEAELSNRNLLVLENAMLKNVGGRSIGERRIVASILAVPSRSPYDTLIVDAGTAEGVTQDDEVFAGGTIIGTIGAALTHTAIVELFSTPRRKTPVTILHGEVAIPVEAVGEGNGGFSATVPTEAGVSVGDTIFMAGIHPSFFAEIAVVDGSATDSFDVIYFKNPLPVERQLFLQIHPRIFDRAEVSTP